MLMLSVKNQVKCVSYDLFLRWWIFSIPCSQKIATDHNSIDGHVWWWHSVYSIGEELHIS